MLFIETKINSESYSASLDMILPDGVPFTDTEYI